MTTMAQNGAPHGAVDLQTKIQQPEVAASLSRLLDRIDELERTIDKLTATVEQAPGLVAMAGDMFDDGVRNAAASGIDINERVLIGLRLLEQVTDPHVAAQLEALLTLAQQAPGLAAMAGDMFDEAYSSLIATGIDPESLARDGGQALMQLMKSGTFDAQTLDVLSNLMQALNTAQGAAERPLGPVGLLRAMNDPDVQRTLGFFMNFAKQFGKSLA